VSIQYPPPAHTPKTYVNYRRPTNALLIIVKVVEFNTVRGHALVFYQLLLVTVLTHYDEPTVMAIMSRVSAHAQLAQLRNSLVVFIRHYVRGFKLGIGDGGCATTVDDKGALLVARAKLAKKCLTRSDHDL
jgi:hypothetical protein